MEGKFARLFDMPDGNQVLVQKAYDFEEEVPVLIIETGLKDSHLEVKIPFTNAGSRDENFQEFNQQKAESWRSDIVIKWKGY